MNRKDNTLRFISEIGEKRDIPINNISEIYFFGEDTLNTRLITFLSQNNVIVHFFNYYDFYSSSLIPRKTKISGKLLVKQVENYTDINKRMKLAKKFVKSAGDNIYRNLRYYNGKDKNTEKAMIEIKFLINEIDGCERIQELMGVEGNIHKIYFEQWNVIVNQEIDFNKRVKRPPDNMINTLISFLNSLVYTTVLSEIYKT